MARKRKITLPGQTAPGSVSRAVTPSNGQGLQFNIPTLTSLSFMLVFFTTILYHKVTSYPFINYDDDVYFTGNPNIQGGLTFAAVKWAWTSFFAANWHPITWMVHQFNFQLYGMDAGGHHLANLIFHLANVVLLFLLLAAATRAMGRSLFVAAFFAVHPLNVESVAWASELKNVLCTFFFLLALGTYGWYARRRSIPRYALVFLAYFLALAAKPMAITFPFVLLLIDLWPLGRIETLTEPSTALEVKQFRLGYLTLEKLPLLGLTVFSCWITVRAQAIGKALAFIHPSLRQRLTNALTSYGTYIVQTFVPIRLAPFYPFPLGGIDNWKLLGSALLILSVSTLVALYWRRHPYLLTGWLWYLGTLVPVLGLLQVGGQSHADRYTYIPMMGLLVMIVWGTSELASAMKMSRLVQTSLPILVVLILGVLTARQVGFWRSSYDLWDHAISVTKDNPIAERDLADALVNQKRIPEAYIHMVRAVQLEPNDPMNHVNLGYVYSLEGRREDSLREFNLVIEKTSDSEMLFAAYVDAADSYYAMGDFRKAEEDYRKALLIRPNELIAQRGLAAVERAIASSTKLDQK